MIFYIGCSVTGVICFVIPLKTLHKPYELLELILDKNIFYHISTLIFTIFLVFISENFVISKFAKKDFLISQPFSDLVKIFCFENLVVKRHCMFKMFWTFVLVLIISCKVQNQYFYCCAIITYTRVL